jgi:hypothetical protein
LTWNEPAVEPARVQVDVSLPWIEAGEQSAVTPDEFELAVNATIPLNPLCA